MLDLSPRTAALFAALLALWACGTREPARPEVPAAVEAAPISTAAAVTRPDAWPHEASDLAPDPVLRFGRLDNGLRYVVVENDLPSGTGALRLLFETGSLDEADDQQGLAHFLEHMAFNGSENVPEGEMIKLLERVGLAFGPDTNASTGFGETTYQLDLPNLETETVETAFFLMRETADRLTISPGAVDRERGIILSEERARNTPGLRAYVAEQAFVFPGARHPTRLPIGTVEVINTAPAERLRDLYDRFYRPENAWLVFVGDLPQDAVEARIAETFGDWGGRGAPGARPDLGVVDIDRASETGLFVDPDIQSGVTVTWLTNAAPPADTAAQRAADLTLGIAAGALNRRFTRLTRAEDAPFLGAGAGSFFAFDQYRIDQLSVSTEPGPEAALRGLGAAQDELRRALEFGFSEAEIAEQVTRNREAFRLAAENAGTRRSIGLAEGVLSEIVGDAVSTHPADDAARAEATLDAITPASALAALRARFVRGAGTSAPLLFARQRDAAPALPDQLLAAWADGETREIAPPADAGAAAEFAYTDFGPPGVVAERGRIEDLDITTVRFANGVRLNIKPTTLEDAIARVSIGVGEGELEFGAEGAAASTLLESAFARGGLAAHSADDLQTLLTGTQVSTGISVSADRYVFGGALRPDKLRLQLQVAAAQLTAPGFRPEAQSWFTRAVTNWYETLDATPGAAFAKDGTRILLSDDVRFGVAPLEDLLSATLDDARTLSAEGFANGAIEIGVVGAVDVETVIADVAATFGALPARRSERRAFDDRRGVRIIDGTSAPIVLNHEGQANQGLAVTVWPAADDVETPTEAVRTQTLLAEVFGLKLIDEVREAAGATYSPSAGQTASSVFRGLGYVSASIEVEPQRIAEFHAVVDRIAAEMAAGSITADELERARTPLLEGLRNRLESNSYWLSLASSAQLEPRNLDRHRSAVAGYTAITVEDLTAAAQAVFVPDRAVRFAVAPSMSQPASTPSEATP